MEIVLKADTTDGTTAFKNYKNDNSHEFLSDTSNSVDSIGDRSPPEQPQSQQQQQLGSPALNSSQKQQESDEYVNTKSFIPCKVCGDKASGYHYGVTSCEGCKNARNALVRLVSVILPKFKSLTCSSIALLENEGFFRRSIQKQIEYRCLRDGQCLIIRLNRNRCQYCRFKKCLAVGMSRDSVRYGRVPKGSRDRICDDTTSTVAITESEPDLAKFPAVYDIIVRISQAHNLFYAYTENMIRNIVTTAEIQQRDAPAPEIGQKKNEDEKIYLCQKFAMSITPNVQKLVEFAKRIPGFCDFGQDDQLILVKTNFIEVWLVYTARLMTDSFLIFDDGTIFTIDQLKIIFNHEFITLLFEFTNSFKNLSLNDTELALYSAVVLFNYDRYGITNSKLIECYRNRILEALKVQVARCHQNDDLYETLVQKLTDLRELGIKHCMHLNWYRENRKQLTLPPLFAEIFDITNSDEDS